MSVTDPFGLVGQVLDGQFRVDKLVGEGGFSAVYRGHHQGLGEPIALKCLKLPPNLQPSLVDTFINRFRDESRILYRLSQGNLHIVRSIAAGTTQSPSTGNLVPYMALEWLEGRSVQNDFTVRRTLGQTGRALDVVLKLFETAADGLGYAHSQGVVHRDLNPGNLFLAQTQQGLKMKVLDFGVAKLMHDGALDMGPRQHTVGQIKIFAPAYGAPEQFDDRFGKVAAPSDVYSFALILIEALRDKSINEGQHIGEFALAACDPARRPTPRFFGVDVPDEVDAAFARATRLDPKERWQSVGDFWQSLIIANKVAVERRYETAARETPPLGMGQDPTNPASPANPTKTKAMQARTMPLGSTQTGTPGLPFPPPRAGSSPNLPPQAPQAPSAPSGPSAPNVGRARMATTLGIPGPAGGPPAPVKTSAFAATEVGPPPPSSRRLPPPIPPIPMAAAGAPAAQSSNPFVDMPSQDPLPEDEEEATKVHAPAPEMLRTLAMQDAQNARAQVDARIAAQRAAAASAGAAPPPLPPVLPPPEQEEAAPDSGGTLMMAPQARQQAMGSTLAMASPLVAPPPGFTPQQPPPDEWSTRAMPAVPVGPPQPVQAAPGMQGIPGARGTPPQGMPAVSGAYAQQAPYQAAAVAQQPPPPQQPPVPPPQAARAPYEPAFPPPPSVAQPSLPTAPPTKPLPLVPIMAVLGLLAVGGIVLGALALRGRHATSTDSPTATVSAPSASLVPVPVDTGTAAASAAPTPPPVATSEDTEASAAVVTELDDASVTADAAPEPAIAATTTTTATAATATAGTPTVAIPTPNYQPGMAIPTPAPKPTADPNAFNEGAAKSRLSSAAGVLAFCKHDGGVTGPGSAAVTFAPDGSVSSVGVDPPYAGTREGDCVAAQFKRAKIGAFTGDPRTVKFPFEVPK